MKQLGERRKEHLIPATVKLCPPGCHASPYQSNRGCEHKTAYVAAHKELPGEPVRNTEASPLARVFKYFTMVGGNSLFKLHMLQ